MTDGSSSYWIGFNDIQEEGNFVWADGCPVEFTAWNGSEPNNMGDEDCTTFWASSSRWNDLPCSSEIGFICQKGGRSCMDDECPNLDEYAVSDPSELMYEDEDALYIMVGETFEWELIVDDGECYRGNEVVLEETDCDFVFINENSVAIYSPTEADVGRCTGYASRTHLDGTKSYFGGVIIVIQAPEFEPCKIEIESEVTVALGDSVSVPIKEQGNQDFKYWVMHDYADYETHENNCWAAGGELVFIEDESENDYIRSLLSSGDEFWLGLYDWVDYSEEWNQWTGMEYEQRDYHYFWLTADTFLSYNNFAEGYPNQPWEVSPVCGYMDESAQWKDDFCGHERKAVCKVPAKEYEYSVLTTQMSWYEAQYECEQWGGNLASFGSSEEYYNLEDYMYENELWGMPIWMAHNDQNQDGEWENVDGSNFVGLTFGDDDDSYGDCGIFQDWYTTGYHCDDAAIGFCKRKIESSEPTCEHRDIWIESIEPEWPYFIEVSESALNIFPDNDATLAGSFHVTLTNGEQFLSVQVTTLDRSDIVDCEVHLDWFEVYLDATNPFVEGSFYADNSPVQVEMTASQLGYYVVTENDMYYISSEDNKATYDGSQVMCEGVGGNLVSLHSEE